MRVFMRFSVLMLGVLSAQNLSALGVGGFLPPPPPPPPMSPPPAESSRPAMAAPERFNLTGVPSTISYRVFAPPHAAGLDYEPQDFRQFLLQKHPSYNPQSKSILGIYSRGDALVDPGGEKWNMLGMYAFYGGNDKSRLYGSTRGVDLLGHPFFQFFSNRMRFSSNVGVGTQTYLNSINIGSIVSPQVNAMRYEVGPDPSFWVPKPDPYYLGGFAKANIAKYDPDLMDMYPPVWPAPVGATGGSMNLTVLCGSIYDPKKR